MDPRARYAKDIHFSFVGARPTLWRSAVERKASTSVLSADGAAPCKTAIRNRRGQGALPGGSRGSGFDCRSVLSVSRSAGPLPISTKHSPMILLACCCAISGRGRRGGGSPSSIGSGAAGSVVSVTPLLSSSANRSAIRLRCSALGFPGSEGSSPNPVGSGGIHLCSRPPLQDAGTHFSAYPFTLVTSAGDSFTWDAANSHS